MASPKVVLHVAGRDVDLTNPDKVYFPATGYTKRDIADYYLAVAPAALRAVAGRPLVMKRYVNGVDQPAFYQKRAPESRPPWVKTVQFRFPSGRTASEIVLEDAAQLAWIVNLGCIELHTHPIRADDLRHPDELRIDLDPQPDIPWTQVQETARCVKAVLDDLGLVGWPKTSGSRGIHVNVRIERRWEFEDNRRCALGIGREVCARIPALATVKWWKEERHGVFLDYNQNAPDRTTAAAYSIRPRPDARVSWPFAWSDLDAIDPAEFTIKTVPALLAARGDAHAAMDASAGSLEKALALAERHEATATEPDEAWPPHFPKKMGEAKRVAPSRARKPKA